MHYGRIDRDTAAGRVYRILKARQGEWIYNLELASLARVNLSLSTVVSQVREQIDEEHLLECKAENGNGKRSYYYRLASKDGQLALL
jgi:hypothetical protein